MELCFVLSINKFASWGKGERGTEKERDREKREREDRREKEERMTILGERKIYDNEVGNKTPPASSPTP